jgi:hypothetical protein
MRMLRASPAAGAHCGRGWPSASEDMDRALSSILPTEQTLTKGMTAPYGADVKHMLDIRSIIGDCCLPHRPSFGFGGGFRQSSQEGLDAVGALHRLQRRRERDEPVTAAHPNDNWVFRGYSGPFPAVNPSAFASTYPKGVC